jgi:hypothetical protein
MTATKPKTKPDPRIAALEQQIQDRLDRLEPILAEISECEHLIDQLRARDDEDEFFDRVMTTGHVVQMLSGLCSPRLDVAFDVMVRLFNLNHAEHDDAEAEPADAKVMLH